MSPIHHFRTAMLSLTAVVSVVGGTLASAQDTEHLLTLAPASSALDRRVVTAQQALQRGDLGSVQEEVLVALVSASTSPLESRDANAVMARRVLVAQQALASTDLGSVQEEALSALVAAEDAEDAR